MGYVRKSVVLFLCCMMIVPVIAGLNDVTIDAKKAEAGKVSVKKLEMEVSDTHKLPTFKKKKYTYKCSNSKIASVSRYGKLRALKEGKCIVKVLKNKKLYAKYNVKVSVGSDKNEKAQPTQIPQTIPATGPASIISPSPTSVPTDAASSTEDPSRPIAVTGGVIAAYQGTIEEITQVSDDKYQYKLRIEQSDYCRDYLTENGIVYEAVTCDFKDVQVGDHAYIVYHTMSGKKVIGDTIYYGYGGICM